MVRTRQKTRLEAAKLQKENSSSTAEVSTSESDVVSQARLSHESLARETKPQDRLVQQNSSQMGTVEQLALTAASRVTERLRTDSNEQEHSTSNINTSMEVLEKRMEAEASSVTKRDIPTSSGLASSLQPRITEELYFSFDQDEILQSCNKGILEDVDKELMKRSVITPDFERKERVPAISQSRYTLQKTRKVEREKSAGKAWFNMPAPHITPELKNDLKIIKMRGSLDPSRHYKANDSKETPRYFQVGRVVSGPAEFYSGRIPRRQQKQTVVEELLANEEVRRYHKKKYLELQKKFMSGTTRYRSIKHRKKYKK